MIWIHIVLHSVHVLVHIAMLTAYVGPMSAQEGIARKGRMLRKALSEPLS